MSDDGIDEAEIVRVSSGASDRAGVKSNAGEAVGGAAAYDADHLDGHSVSTDTAADFTFVRRYYSALRCGNICGPEDDRDPSVNIDIDSLCGEEDEAGFDDMPVECGWEDESDESDEDDEEDE